MTTQLQALLSAVDSKKAQLDEARPLPPHTVASLHEKLMLEWTYHSNAIEGNTLSLRETKVVLEGITIGGKSVREHIEATNHAEAVGYVEEIVAGGEPLTEWQIRNIHGMVMKGDDRHTPGRYRQENVVIAGASTTPPDFLHLPQEMASLMAWYGASNDHPVARAAELHTRFVKIHPFSEGNGRTGRLILNVELLRAGYPITIIRKDDRLDYYNTLDEACVSGDYTGITRLVAEAVQRTLDTYVKVLGLSDEQTQRR
jgi:Fic family protein